MENWKPIENFPLYEISDLGRVRNVQTQQLMTPAKNNSNHSFVGLSLNGVVSTKGIHRLVLDAFVGKKPDGFHANHINGNKDDNALTNLRYVANVPPKGFTGTGIKRGEEHGRAKLTEKDVLEIRRRLAEGVTVYRIAKDYPMVKYMTIKAVKDRRSWKHLKEEVS